MNWQEILTILIPMFALMGWIYNRLDKKFDRMDQRFDKVDERFERLEGKIDSMNIRVTRLEGRFEERGYWESREMRKTGTEDKK